MSFKHLILSSLVVACAAVGCSKNHPATTTPVSHGSESPGTTANTNGTSGAASTNTNADTPGVDSTGGDPTTAHTNPNDPAPTSK